jgi:spermidine synthase
MLSLIYQVTWIRELSLLFGSTIFSLSSVTAFFFLGLSVGSTYFGRKSTHLKSPLKSYGILEICIGLWVVVSPLIFIGLSRVFPQVYTQFYETPLVLRSIQVLCVGMVIFPPCFCMGGAIPLLVAGSTKEKSQTLVRVSQISGTNTLGAFTGVILAAAVFTPRLGLINTPLVLGAANLLIGFFILRFLGGYSAHLPNHTAKSVPSKEILPQSPAIFVILFFLMGFLGMANEIVWTRFLAFTVQNSVYTYTVTLAVIIAGLGTGNLTPLIFAKRKVAPSAVVTGILCLLAVFQLIILYFPPEIILKLSDGQALPSLVLLGGILFFVPSLLMGMAFPFAVHSISEDRNSAGLSTGILYAADSLGGVAGALLTGFVLLPMLGMTVLSHTIAAAFFCGALLTVFGISAGGHRNKQIIGSVLTLLFLLLYPRLSTVEVPRDYITHGEGELTAWYEGLNSLLSVVDYSDRRELYINNLWQGENRKNRQIMAAHVPMILAGENAKDVALIGTGAGQTARRFLYYPVEHLYCVDIEKEIEPLLRTYFPGEWMDDPRVEFVTEDGRVFFSHKDRQFDVISIEVGQTFRPNIGGLYTRDFYEDIRHSLSPGGVVSQFIPLASLNFEYYTRSIKTFRDVFPHSVLWYNDSEFILVGRKDGFFENTVEQFHRITQTNRRVREDLAYSYYGGHRAYLNHAEVFFAGFLSGPKQLEEMTKNTEPLRDVRPELEYFSAANPVNNPFVDSISAYLSDPQTITGPLPDGVYSSIIELRDINLNEIMANMLLLHYYNRRHPALLEQAHSYNPLNISILRELISRAQREHNYEKIPDYYDLILRTAPNNPRYTFLTALSYHQLKETDSALSYYYETLQLDPAHVRAHINTGIILEQRKQFKKARHHYRRALSIDPSNEEARKNLSRLRQEMEEEGSGQD